MNQSLMNVSAGDICKATISWSNTNTDIMKMQNALRIKGATVLAEIQEETITTAVDAANKQQTATEKNATGQIVSGVMGFVAAGTSFGMQFKSFSSEDLNTQLSDATKLKGDLENDSPPSIVANNQPNLLPANAEHQINAWKGSETRSPNFRNYQETDQETQEAITALRAPGKEADLALVQKNLDNRIAEIKSEQNAQSVQKANSATNIINEVNTGISNTSQAAFSINAAKAQNEHDKEQSYAQLLNSLEQSFSAYISNQQSAAQASQQTALQNAANASVQLATAG